MVWRKWLVRGLVFTVVGGLAATGFLYQRWTNPAAVRRQVIDNLSTHLVGAWVSLESAHMRLLGGISFSELRLSQRDDPTRAGLAYVPSGVIYLDKEQVLNGKVAIRKVVLDRPRLHVRRGPEGGWNLTGLLGPVHPEVAIPTIEIRQGTIVLEDHCACCELPAVEIADVNLTIINDPLPTLNFQGTARSDLAGVVQIGGKLQRLPGDATLFVQADGMAVGPSLMSRLEAYCPQLARDDWQHDDRQHLEGRLSLRADLGYSPAAIRPWSYRVRCRLTGGKLRHPQVPLPLDDLEMTVNCLDGLTTLEKLTARSGTARVEAAGSARALRTDADFQGTLKVEHLPLTPEIFEHLPANLRKVKDEYAPSGPVRVTLQYQRSAGQEVKRILLQPEDLTASFLKFPYTVEHITGTIAQEIDTARHRDEMHLDLAGLAGGQRVFIKGDIHDVGPTAAVHVTIWGTNLPLDQKLQAALINPQHQRLATSFHPTGQADFTAFIHRDRGSHEFANRFLIRFHGATLRYDIFSYPLEEVSGLLDLQPEHWEFHDFRGTHQGAVVTASGQFQADPHQRGHDRLTVKIRGDNVLLNSELEAALEPELKHTWKTLHPSGRMMFTALVERLGDRPPDIEVALKAAGCTIRPDFFPYQLEELTGSAHYAHRWVQLENIRARHGATIMTLDRGRLFLKPEGGVWADIENLQGSPLLPDADLLAALPPVLRTACEAVQIKDPVTLNTHLTLATLPGVGTPPDVYWEGELKFTDAALKVGVPLEHVSGRAACQGRYNGRQLEGLVGNVLLDRATLFKQPFQDIRGALEVKKDAPNVLVMPGLHARVFGGEVYGPLRLEFGSRPHYTVNLTASQVKLEEFGRLNLGSGAPISGLAMARLYLTGTGGELGDLTGRGTIDVEDGRMYNLPLLLDLLKFLSLRPPDGTAFEEAHATFGVHGQRVAIDRLDLFGNSISLRGQGEMNLDGTDIKLDFFAIWGRVMQMLPPLVKELPQDVSKHLLKIKMRGRLNDVHFTKEPVPVLVDPLKGFLEKLAKLGRGGASREKSANKPETK